MEDEQLAGGSGTKYEMTVEETPPENLAADEVYRVRVAVAEKKGQPYIFASQASFDSEALFFSRQIHSEKSEDELKQEWKRELEEWVTHMARHYF